MRTHGLIIGYFWAIFTIMTWSMNIIYSKYLAGILTPSEISFYRWFIALFLMIPISFRALVRDRIRLILHWKTILLMALSGLGLQNQLIYCAGYTASATNMSLISILGPVFLILLSRQHVFKWQWIGMALAIFGVLMIILDGNFENLAGFHFVSGDIYMLGSAFLFAVYALLERRAPDDIDPTALLTAGIAISAFIFFWPALPTLIQTPFWKLPHIAVGILLILGFINSALSYLSWDIVIKKTGTIKAGTMYYTLPIFSITAAYFLLHEPIKRVQLFGALLILIGVLCVIRGTPKERHNKNSG